MAYRSLKREVAKLRAQFAELPCPECGGRPCVIVEDPEHRLDRAAPVCPQCGSPDRLIVLIVRDDAPAGEVA